VLKTTFVEIGRQPIGIEVTQSPNAIITTTRVETIVAPSTNVFRGGILIGFVTYLGSGSGKISARRNLNWSSKLPTTTTKVYGTP
jgi:hypothetical protein